MASAEAFGLLDEIDVRSISELAANVVPSITDHDDDPLNAASSEGIEHVLDHGPTQHREEDLREVRLHARALSGGENDSEGIHAVGSSVSIVKLHRQLMQGTIGLQSPAIGL